MQKLGVTHLSGLHLFVQLDKGLLAMLELYRSRFYSLSSPRKESAELRKVKSLRRIPKTFFYMLCTKKCFQLFSTSW